MEKMIICTMKEMERNLQAFKTCRASNLLAVKNEGEFSYVIYSYATPICKVTLHGSVQWFDSRYYSPTTSRHQNIIRRAFNIK